MASGWLRRFNLVSVLLFLSLGANLFFVGWLLGGHPHVHGHVSGLLGHSEHFGDQIQTSLSPAGAAIMEDTFNIIRKRFSRTPDNIRASRERIKDAMTADPFDATRFIEVSKDVRSGHESDRDAADEEMARAIARLSPDDRRKLADIRSISRFGGKGGVSPFH